MPAPLWWAHLNTKSPRYETWRGIIGSDTVLLKKPSSFAAKTEDGTRFDAYALDVEKLTEDQEFRLVRWISEKFGVSNNQARAEINTRGFPIREADVIVAMSMRAFM